MRRPCHLLSVVLACLPGVPAFADAPPEGQEDPSPSVLLAEAREFRSQGKWDEALALLQQVVNRADEDRAAAAEAQLVTGRYLLDRGDAEAAEAALKEVAEAFADQRETVFRSWVYLVDARFARGDLHEAEQRAGQLASVAAAPAEHAWAHLKLAEVDLNRLRRGPAIERLQAVIAESQSDPVTGEPRNWARVRLAEVFTHESRFDEADQVGDAILADHAEGRADDRQAAWALIWKARSRMFTNRVGPLAEAPEPARMAAALAIESGNADLAYAAHYLLGEIYGRLGREADRLVKEGEGAYAASPVATIVDQTRQAQGFIHEGEWGPLMVEAMEQYRAAMEVAGQFNLDHEKEAGARHQCANLMRHLGQRDKAIATLRMGIRDPAKLSPAENRLAMLLASFLDYDEARAWSDYLLNPAATPDPTASIVQAEFGTEAPQASSSEVTGLWDRLYWRGRFYERQREDEAALSAYLTSLQHTPHTWARAQTHYQIVCVSARVYRDRALNKNSEQAKEVRQIGKQSADAAVEDWISLLPYLSSRDTPGAIEKAVYAYSYLGYWSDGLSVAQRIDGLMESEGVFDSLTRAFSKYTLMHAWGQHGNHAEAATVADQLINMCMTEPRADLLELRHQAMLYGAHHHAASGDRARGQSMLDLLEYEDPSPHIAVHIQLFRQSNRSVEEVQQCQ